MSDEQQKYNDPEATVTEVVTQARRHAIYAANRLRELAGGAGGRGAVAQVSACRAILDAARVTGSDAEELNKMPLDQAQRLLRAGNVTNIDAASREAERKIAAAGGLKALR